MNAPSVWEQIPGRGRKEKCLVFDDSFEHEAWNLSQETRAVLIIDFWHPDLTASETWALEQIMKFSPQARKHARAVLKNTGKF